MHAADYVYEVRDRATGALLATGRLPGDSRPALGERFDFEGQEGAVVQLIPLAGGEVRVLVEVEPRRASASS
jgi:hypothetical protein